MRISPHILLHSILSVRPTPLVKCTTVTDEFTHKQTDRFMITCVAIAVVSLVVIITAIKCCWM